MNRFRLSLLGAFDLQGPDGAALRLPTRKAEALLAYLALSAPAAQRRETLAALLWGDAPEAAALASLRQSLSLIGKACGEGVIISTGRMLSLHAGRFEIDACQLEAIEPTAPVEALARGAALYRGDLLAGLTLDEPGFDDWLQARREHLREHTGRLLLRLMQGQREARAIDAAIRAGLQLLALDPLLEAAHRALMQLYAGQGRRTAALRQYQVCVQVLQRELGAEPEGATRRLYNELLCQTDDDEVPGTGMPAPALAFPTPLHEAPLIGRGAEWAALQDALRSARAERGNLVTLLGDAGLGKTRLTEELAGSAQAVGMRVLVGHCHESQQIVAFVPWVEALRAAGVAGDAGLLAAIGAAACLDLASLMPEVHPYAAAQVAESAALARQARLFEAVTRTIGALCERGPVLLVLEDLHWCDELSLRLLPAVARRALAWPLLIVATARAEEVGAAPALLRTLRELDRGPLAGRLQRLPLQPLSHRDTLALVAALQRPAADVAAGHRLAEKLWAASEGNPFVIIEALRSLDAEPADLGVAALSPPERVRELVAGQVERLTPDARLLLNVLAVAGREARFALLQRASGLSEQAAAAALEELVRRRLARLSGDAFDVLHARVRQVVRDRLLEPSRQGLHLALAEALEAGRDAASQTDDLAFHYDRTHRHDKAVIYLSRLAQRAAHDGAHAAALEILGRALVHAERLPAADIAGQRRELLLRRARSLFFLGRFTDVLDLLLPLQEEIDAAEDPLTAATYYLRRGSTRTYVGEHAPAIADAERALREADACDDRATMGKAHFLLSLEHFWARPVLGVEHGEKAVALLETGPERWWTGQACWILGLNLSYLGQFEAGLAAEARASALAEELGDRRLASYAAWTTGFIHTLAGDAKPAVDQCRRSLRLALDPLNRMTSLGLLSLALVEAGQADEPLQLLEEAIPQALSFRIPQMQGLFLAFRAQALMLRGELDAAAASASQGAAITDAAGYVYGRGWAERVQARIARAAGDGRSAELALHRAAQTFAGMGASFEAARTRFELAGWGAGDRRGDEADGLAPPGVSRASEAGPGTRPPPSARR